METLIFLGVIIFLLYLLLFTTRLDPLLKRIPAFSLPAMRIWNPSPEERRRRAQKALDLYSNSHDNDLSYWGSDYSDSGCDGGSDGGSDGGCGDG